MLVNGPTARWYEAMKRALFLIMLAPVLSAQGQDTPQIIDCGTSKAATIQVSPDGNYAFGWTLVPLKSGTVSFDWSPYAMNGDPASGMPTVRFYSEDKQDPAYTYKLVDCIIDLKKKSWVELPSDAPYFPHRSHGYYTEVWSSDGKYTLIQSDADWYTNNLWLVNPKSSEIHDLVPTMETDLNSLLRAKRPLEYKAMKTCYYVSYDKDRATFQKDAVTIPFESDIPKSMDVNSGVSGTVTVHLPDGALIRVTSSIKTNDPFQSNPALAAADKELNQVYVKLSGKLSPKEQTKLKADEFAWVDQRDQKVCSETMSYRDPSTPNTQIADLIKLTKERIEVLRARLAQ